MTRYIAKVYIIALAVALIAAPAASRQGNTVESLLKKAEEARFSYDFKRSVLYYDMALDGITDSLRKAEVMEAKILSENGAGMMDFVSEPTVVAKHTFSVEDFFLYYPLPDKSWRPLPSPLDTTDSDHPLVKSVYVPENSREIFYSAPDEESVRNIYRTEFRDSIWSIPSLLNEAVTSPGDEIYPMFSSDGKQMWFASSGLFGMGGFDLYVSEWDEEKNEWGAPSNMGFPYSSPYDDFLFINTPDGKYSIFASNRDCSKDSVCVYVLEFDVVPVRKSVSGASELAKLCSLEPEEDPARMDHASAVSTEISENEDIRRYVEKAAEIRALKDTIMVFTDALDRERVMYAESDDDQEREMLIGDILFRESSLPILQDSLKRASAALQKIEMEFLFNGVVLDPAQLMYEADKEVKGAATGYVFTKNSLGTPLQMTFEVPKKEFDYTFMILPEGRFAEDNTLPSGIVYQIQMFSLSNPAKVSQLKGLSPVFLERTANGRYTYRAGLFRKYNDVLSNLNKVKRLGFKGAFITAFNDGKPITIQRAKALEKTVKTVVSVNQIVIVPEDGILQSITTRAIQQNCSKDIVRMQRNGRVEYVVGPFDDEKELEKVIAAIRATGEESLSTVKIGEKQVN